ncbi:MAG: nitrogen regulation protein NR(II) [Pseudomonadales bacterium]
MNVDCLHARLLDNLATAVILLDDELTISYVNSAAEVLLQVSGPRVLGEPISHVFTTESDSERGLRDALRDGSAYTRRKALLTLPAGQQITVDYAATPFQQTGGPMLIIELQPLDRLLRISREETNISSHHTTRTLIRGLAHEIKNPLGGLRGAAQLLERQLPSPELKDYINVIIDEADRLRSLVDRLLGPHKVSEQQAVNIHEVLERVCALVEAESPRQLAIERDYDPSIPELIGDAEQLIQASLNIMRNAMQELQSIDAQQVATIKLTTRVLRRFTIGKRQHRLVLRVDIADNGPGVAAELLDSIFFPMVSGRADGTGLGLSIAHSIVHQHAGLIECASQPGDTVFSMFIPLECS